MIKREDSIATPPKKITNSYSKMSEFFIYLGDSNKSEQDLKLIHP